MRKNQTAWNKGKTKAEYPQFSNSGVKKGNIPWNKGLHIYTGGKKFEKGIIPWNKGKQINKTCLECDNPLIIPEYRERQGAKFCTHECYAKWLEGKKHTQEHNNKIGLKGEKHPMWDKKHSKKARIRMSTSHRGISEAEWNGFSTSERRRLMQGKDYILWRTSVFMRDDYTCQFCNVRGVPLQADHIKPWALYPELRYAIDNGRTLCVDCHRQTDTWGNSSMYRGTSPRKLGDSYE